MEETPFDDDKLHEECGVFGVYGHDDAAATPLPSTHRAKVQLFAANVARRLLRGFDDAGLRAVLQLVANLRLFPSAGAVLAYRNVQLFAVRIHFIVGGGVEIVVGCFCQ